MTSFLCTDQARDIYRDAAKELASWTRAEHPDERPTADAFTNQEVLTEARDFLE